MEKPQLYTTTGLTGKLLKIGLVSFFSGRDDIREVVDRLIFDDDKHLTREEKVRVVENVLRECDNDEDGALCFPEFQQAMAKSPDFIQLFKMYI